jgi:polyhydroxybutyrate depolymerase
MGRARAFIEKTRLDETARSEGFLLVAPEGEGVLQTWNAGNCCGAARDRGVDDVAFLRQVLSAVADENCVDPDRVFATGHSNGAMLAHRLACEAADMFAAIASVGGASGRFDLTTQPPSEIYSCAPVRPVPVLHIHGLADACYRFEGGIGQGVSGTHFRGVEETMHERAELNDCGATTRVILDNGSARCVAREGCRAETVTCTIDGAGHVWPGASDYPSPAMCGGTISDALVANDVVWDFFERHPR